MRAEEVKKELELLFCKESEIEKEQLLIGIDGMCCSGKTTLCEELLKKYDCNVFHMDDFFLRPEQRTAERLSEVGGNVDYERFKEEVLKPLQQGETFSYRPFDCSTGGFKEKVEVFPKKWNIIEGVYCLHPHFGEAYDYRFFMDVEEEEQKRRVLKRSGAEKYQRFVSEWIPKENAYFQAFRVASMERRPNL